MDWEDLIYQIEEKFGIKDRRDEDFIFAETSAGEKIIGKKEVIEFNGPKGKMKLEKISRPKIIDKKVLHTKRIGGRVAVDYVYSNEEMVEQIKIYQWNFEISGWEEISGI